MQWPSGFWLVPVLGLQHLAPRSSSSSSPPPKQLLEHQECTCSRQCYLPKYFLSSVDMFLQTLSCIKLHRAAFWPEVISSMFPSTGKHFFLVVCTEEIILYAELCDP